MNTATCRDNEKFNFPRSLSKEATAEILGEDLCVLFAIGVGGKVIRYYPDGFELLNLEDIKMKPRLFHWSFIPKYLSELILPKKILAFKILPAVALAHLAVSVYLAHIQIID